MSEMFGVSQGDSGAPLVVCSGGVYRLAGVVSRGYGCGHPDFPGLYAPLYHPGYLAWIKRAAFPTPLVAERVVDG